MVTAVRRSSVVPSPSWPLAFEFTDVDAGTYQVSVVLDIGSDDPTFPGDEDIQVGSEPITVTDEEGVWLELEIVDS